MIVRKLLSTKNIWARPMLVSEEGQPGVLNYQEHDSTQLEAQAKGESAFFKECPFPNYALWGRGLVRPNNTTNTTSRKIVPVKY